MIFSEPLLAKVLAGGKTVTRRPVKYNRSGKILPYPYKPNGGPGGTYALQGPPKKGSKARARTIPGYRLRVKLISEPMVPWPMNNAEARREGFDSPTDFAAFLAHLYGSGCLSKLYRRIEFELVEEQGE